MMPAPCTKPRYSNHSTGTAGTRPSGTSVLVRMCTAYEEGSPIEGGKVGMKSGGMMAIACATIASTLRRVVKSSTYKHRAMATAVEFRGSLQEVGSM